MLYDAIVIGAGPAGLTAATYLGRFRRRVLVLNGGPPRASWIPESHNTPGFPQGVGGPELLDRLRSQALLYGAEILPARAEELGRRDDAFELSLSGETAQTVLGRTVLLATGVIDIKPELNGIEDAIRRAVVRICPICDAFEAIDKAIAVLGDGELGVREALFLRTYSERVTLLHLGGGELDAKALAAKGVDMIRLSLSNLRLTDVVELTTSSIARTFDCLYLALGCEMQSRLAVRWGATHDAENNLLVDSHQQTSLDGVYAAGDVVRGLNQIAVACAESAIAATAIHRRLRERDGAA